MKKCFFVFFSILTSYSQLMASDAYLEIISKLKKATQVDTGLINLANAEALDLALNGQYKKAEQISALTYSQSKKDNYKRGQAASLYTYSIIKLGKGDVENGLNHLVESRVIYESINDSNGIVKCYVESGITYFTQKEFKDALSEFENCYKFIQIKEENKIALNRYLSGLCLIELNLYERAELYLKQAEQLYIKNNLIFNIHECYTGLAELYFKRKELALAKKYYEKNIDYFLDEKEYTGLAINTFGLGNIYNLQNNYKEAKKYYLNAYNYSLLSGELYRKDEYAKALSALYLKEKDYKNAYTYNEIFHAAHDTFYNSENSKAVNTLQSKLKIARKQYENDLLKKQQVAKDQIIAAQTNSLYVVVGASALLLIFAIYAYVQFQNKKRLSKELLRLNSDILLLSKEIEEKNKLLEKDNYKKAINIQAKEKRILDFAFFNAHELRAAVARILGLVNVFKHSYYNQEDLSTIVEMVEKSTLGLDDMVKDFGNRLIVIEEEENKSE